PGAIATALVALVKEPPRALPAKPKAGAAPKAVFDRTLVTYLGIVTLFALGNSSDAFLLLRARDVGVPTSEVPVLWSALNLSKVVWAYVGGNLADRLPRARLVAGGWVVYAAVYLGLGLAAAPWHVWGLFVVYGVFYGLTEPVEKALVAQLVSPSARGRAFGVYNFAQGATTLPASLLTGALWKLWGPAAALETGAAIAAAACAALLGWDGWRARIRAAAEAEPAP